MIKITTELLNQSLSDFMDASRADLMADNEEYQAAYQEFLKIEKKYGKVAENSENEKLVDELIIKRILWLAFMQICLIWRGRWMR